MSSRRMVVVLPVGQGGQDVTGEELVTMDSTEIYDLTGAYHEGRLAKEGGTVLLPRHVFVWGVSDGAKESDDNLYAAYVLGFEES